MELNLSSHVIRNYGHLEDITQLWRTNVINPRETPGLAILAQFKTTVDSMTALKYLNIGKYNGEVHGIDENIKYTLQRLFRHIVINLSPFDDTYPVEEDPCSVFQEGFTLDPDTQSNPSASTTSTASTIPTEDVGC